MSGAAATSVWWRGVATLPGPPPPRAVTAHRALDHLSLNTCFGQEFNCDQEEGDCLVSSKRACLCFKAASRVVQLRVTGKGSGLVLKMLKSLEEDCRHMN